MLKNYLCTLMQRERIQALVPVSLTTLIIAHNPIDAAKEFEKTILTNFPITLSGFDKEYSSLIRVQEVEKINAASFIQQIYNSEDYEL